MVDSLTLASFALAAFLAATAATMMGFGVGTSLTPIFALVYPAHLAVMLVAVVHFLSNLFRLALFRRHVDTRLVRRFGILSIAGALVGSLAQGFVQSDWLKVLLGVLLILIGGSEVLHRGPTWHFPRRIDQVGGLFSGILGGLLGNQGAVRGAYLANYDIPKESFVATAALIAVFIDSTRIPVYLLTQWGQITSAWPVLLGVTFAAYCGTYLGQRLVGRISQAAFKRVVNVMVAVFGIVVIVQGLWAVAGPIVAIVVGAAMLILLIVVTILAQGKGGFGAWVGRGSRTRV